MKNFTKGEGLLFLAIIFLSISQMGIVFNFNAINSNNCKMPVYTDKPIFCDNAHFTFSDKEKVNYFFFTDIIHSNIIRERYDSIGDIFIYSGLLFFIIFMVKFAVFQYKRRKLLTSVSTGNHHK